MSRRRHLIALSFCALASLTFLAWLGAALAGAQPKLLPGVQLGHWSNLRLVAWLLVGAALVHPAREAWLEPLERALVGRAKWILPAGLGLFAVAFKVTQHVAFATTAYDLSMYHYAVRHAWADGPGFMWAFGIEQNFLAEHCSPVLLAFVPLDFIFRSPLSLLVSEGMLFGLGAFTLAGAARALGLRPLLAQCIAAVYATNFLCWDALNFDFHPEALLPTTLFATVWALKAKRAGWLAVSLIAALSIKEDVAVALVPMVALVWFDEKKSWRWPLAVTAVTLVWFIFAVKVAMPLARPPGQPWEMFAVRYGHWGPTPGSAIAAMLSRPGEVLALLFDRPVDTQLRQLAYVPLLDPLAMLASVPAILEQRLSSSDLQRELAFYYGIGVVAVWLLGLVRATRWAERRFGFTVGLLLATAPMLYHPHSRVLTPTSWQDLEDDRLLAKILPPDADVLAQTTVVPHLPVSTKVKLFPGVPVDYVVLRPAIHRWPLTDQEYAAAVRQLLDDQGFGVVARTPTLVILRRGAPRDDNELVKAMLPSSQVSDAP